MTARPRIIGITQARMGSTRLPGKVLMSAAGKPLLQHQLERLARCPRLDGVVVATTDQPADTPVADLAGRLGFAVHRGSETDVLDRFYRAAAAQRADMVVRFTADCPLVDPALVTALVDMALAASPPPDYAGVDVCSFPRGLDAELVPFPVLEQAWREATAPGEREHVLTFVWQRPDRFRTALLRNPQPVGGRWCVDTPEDLELVRRLLETLAPRRPDFGWRDCLAVLEAHPHWAAINRAVPQKSAG